MSSSSTKGDEDKARALAFGWSVIISHLSVISGSLLATSNLSLCLKYVSKENSTIKPNTAI